MRKLIMLSIFILVFSLTLYSSQKNKLRDLYEITEEKVYMVRISIPTMEDVEKLKDLGIECISPGKLSIKVTEAQMRKLSVVKYTNSPLTESIKKIWLKIEKEFNS